MRLATSNKLVDLKAGEADVAIRAGARPWEGLVSVELMKVDFTPMCAPSFWKRMTEQLGREPEPADLPNLPLISPEDYWWDKWFEAAGVEGAPTGRARPASGSTARPTRAMRRWAGRGSCC